MRWFYSLLTKLRFIFGFFILASCYGVLAEDIEIDLGANPTPAAKSPAVTPKQQENSPKTKSPNAAAQPGDSAVGIEKLTKKTSEDLGPVVNQIKVSSLNHEVKVSLVGENLSEPIVAKINEKKILVKFQKTKLKIPKIIKGNKALNKIRSSDHSGEAWIVLDLTKSQNFNVEKTISGFLLTLKTPGDKNAGKQQVAADQVEPEKTVSEIEKPNEKGLFSRLIDASIKPFDKGIKIVLTSDGPPKYTVRKLAQPVKLIMRFHNTKLEIAKKFKNDESQLKKGGLVLLELRQIGPSFSPISEAILTLIPGTIHQIDRDLNQVIITLSGPAALEKPVEKRGNLNQLVSLDIEGADLNAVVKTLASEAGFDVDLVSGPLGGTVNEKFKDVPLKTALATLLAPGVFDYEVQGNTLRIGPQGILKTSKGNMPHITEIITPSGGMTADQFDRLVQAILRKVNDVKVTPDLTRNVLILNGTPSDIEDYKRTIKDLKLDEGTGGGDRITKIVKLNYAQTADIKGILDRYLTPMGQAIINPEITKKELIIRETAGNMGVLLELIKELDQKPAQVLVESTIIEVESEKDINLGINWTANKNSGDPTVNAGFGAGGQSGVAPGIITFGTVKSGLNISATLQAIETRKKGKIISRPRIATQSGVKAEIREVEKVVVATTSSSIGLGGVQTFTTTFNTFDLPIDLNVTPRITEDGRITTIVDASITSQSGTALPGAPPPTNVQNTTTTLTTKNGETIVIGGLVREVVQDSVNGIPLLSSIPIIGTLFQNHDKTTRKVELIIFITPTILED